MTSYPYGRRGIVSLYSEDTASLDELKSAGQQLDNETHKDGDTIYLYEAPVEQDPGRGYYSVWVRDGSHTYTQKEAMSGDDGMIYELFTDNI